MEKSKINFKKKVIISIESLPADIVSYFKDNFQFVDLSDFLSDYKTIKTYDLNLRKKWNGILKSLPKFPDPEIVIFRTYKILDRNLIDIFPENILFLRAGSGYDNIDIKHAIIRKCKIENTPLANTNAAFEHAISLMFGAIKKLVQFDSSVRKGNWRDGYELNHEVYGKKILIIGYGNIGSKVANLVKFLGMDVYIFDPMKSLMGLYEKLPDFEPIPINVSLNVNLNYLYDLICEMDIISFHIPLYDLTYKIINKILLEKMKKNSILINTSRGELFEPSDVINYFTKNKNRFLATDVLPDEPCYGKSELYDLQNCLITPHIGAYTYEARIRLKEELIKCIDSYFNENKILFPINDQFYFSEYFKR